MNLNYKVLLSGLLLFYSIVFGLESYAILCIIISLLAVFNVLLEIGKTVAIRSLTILIAVIQWILGPYLSYTVLDPFDYYYMPVSASVYFNLAIPGVLLFAIGLYSINDKYGNEHLLVARLKEYLKGKESLGIYLIVAGFLFTYISPFFPTELAFFFYLLSSLKYIGAFYLFLSERQDKVFYIIIVLGSLILEAFAGTLFHDLLLWVTFGFLLFSLNYKIGILTKASIICLGFLVIFTLQTLKGDYRSAVWSGQVSDEVSQLDLLESSYANRISEGGLFSERNNKHFIYRINQGWIIGNIMFHTPQFEPFANGETVKEGIIATLVPRFLVPDKTQSGGRDYFEKYSGLELVGSTSMDLSPLGEAYANYSSFGGAVFMFFLGLLYAAVLSSVSKWSFTTPTLVLWIPLLFQQAIKAESDITTGVNHLSKAAIVVFLVYWVSNNIFKIKL